MKRLIIGGGPLQVPAALLRDRRGEASSDALLEILIAVCVCCAVLAAMKPLFPSVVQAMVDRIRFVFSGGHA